MDRNGEKNDWPVLTRRFVAWVFWPPRRVLINPPLLGVQSFNLEYHYEKKSSSFRLSRLTLGCIILLIKKNHDIHWPYQESAKVGMFVVQLLFLDFKLLIRSMDVKEVNGLISPSCAFEEAKVPTDRNRWWHRSEPDALEMASSNWLKPSRMNAQRSC